MPPRIIQKTLRAIAKRILTLASIQRLLLRLSHLWVEVRLEQRISVASGLPKSLENVAISDYLPEINAIVPRASSQNKSQTDSMRINLLLPFLSAPHVFGGAATALRTFDRLRKTFPKARIVVTDEVSPLLKAGEFYSNWPILDHLDPDLSINHIVGLGKRVGRSLAIGPNDVFVATIWYSAHLAFQMIEWQEETFCNTSQQRKLIYLIQDFEPGFYPWSARYALARATYSHQERTLAIINTKILADFFDQQGFRFSSKQILEPRLNLKLSEIRASTPVFRKTRTILVYARPTIDRNAFPLIVAALGLWANRFREASRWELIGAGEAFGSIDLGGGCTLQSLGKVSLEEYAELLSRSAIGISLMISPHPSYPPLEMAAFGALVITNGYANKDLSTASPMIRSIDRCDPVSLAQVLERTCAELIHSGRDTPPLIPRDVISWNGNFLDLGDELDGIEDLILSDTAFRADEEKK